MSVWIVWAVAAALFTVGELHTNSFYLAPFAVGAGVAALAAGLGLGAVFTLLVFAAVTAGALMGVRPLARRYRRIGPGLRTGAAALVGEHAVVLETVSTQGGLVRIGSENWTARPYDDEAVLAAGVVATVVQIKGATALVIA